MSGSTTTARGDSGTGGAGHGREPSDDVGGGGGATRSSTPEPPDRWTILGLIRWSAEYLAGKGVESGRLDAEHLLADALGVERLQLYLHFERPVVPEELAAFKPLLLRRAAREPLQYIVGHTQFRELDVKTDERALIPRPETEMLVQEILDHFRGRTGLSALDMGTGSGVIALSLAAEGGFDRVVATDTSSAALELARENRGRTLEALREAAERAARGGAREEDRRRARGEARDRAKEESDGAAEDTIRRVEAVDLREGDLFEPMRSGEAFDLIVSNPPYVEETERESLQPEVVNWEPDGALFAGPGGLDVIERITRGAPEFLVSGGLLALEVGEGQAEAVRDRIASMGEFGESNVRRDLSGRARFVIAERA